MGTQFNNRHYANIAYATGLLLAAASIAWLTYPGRSVWHSSGRANTGHEDIDCDKCHRSAVGTIRQQIQANVKHWIGLRSSAADLGFKAVENADCLNCHDRPNDRHPVFRFLEPRFSEARLALSPQHCVSCHAEHQGLRVSIQNIDLCKHCHGDTALKKDPIDIPHKDLIDSQRWSTCLGCHDFHGNHVMQTETVVDRVLHAETINNYFGGGKTPYSSKKKYHALLEAVGD